jgi:hypothetical protein
MLKYLLRQKAAIFLCLRSSLLESVIIIEFNNVPNTPKWNVPKLYNPAPRSPKAACVLPTKIFRSQGLFTGCGKSLHWPTRYMWKASGAMPNFHIYACWNSVLHKQGCIVRFETRWHRKRTVTFRLSAVNFQYRINTLQSLGRTCISVLMKKRWLLVFSNIT